MNLTDDFFKTFSSLNEESQKVALAVLTALSVSAPTAKN